MRHDFRLATASACLATLAVTASTAQGGQERPPWSVTYRITRTTSPIQIDGVLDEAAWSSAVPIDVNTEVQPGENLPAPVAAQCFVTYDEKTLYVGCRCFDPEPGKIRAHLSDRDGVWRNDYIEVILDTFNDQRRAYQFLVNPLGVQGDSLRNEVSSGRNEDSSWDAIWDSAGRITAEGYQVEMAIPFRSIRFPNGSHSHTWGIAFFRSYPRKVRHQIMSVPLDRSNNCFLCQIGRLEGLEGIAPGHDVELTPTVTSQRTDLLRDEADPASGLGRGSFRTDGGLTARWGITPNLSLNAALNPDFSQVEADVAQLDVNTRFTLFFPEKRPFFMEGADFFSTPIDAVYTRAVADPSWGVRTTGKHGPQAFSVFVARDRLLNLLFPSNQGSSYGSYDLANTSGAFRYRHDVGTASTLGVIATAREGSGYHNRVAGADALLRLSPTDTLSFQLLRSATRYPAAVAADNHQPAGEFAGTALHLEYLHDTRDWAAWAWYRAIAPEFRADLGFVTRVDTRGGEVGGQRTFWGAPGAFLTRASVGAEVQRTEDHRGQLSDETAEVFARFEGPYQSWLNLRTTSFKEVYEGETYSGSRANFFFNARPSGNLTASLAGRLGDAIDYANGRAGRTTRLQPGFTLNLGPHLYLQADHVRERMQVDEGRLYTAHLAQARVVYQFTANSFARLVVQYLEVERDAHLYRKAVAANTSHLFTQVLLSYKLNPQTVAFAGYADTRDGSERLDLARSNRTFFLKVGYAWLL